MEALDEQERFREGVLSRELYLGVVVVEATIEEYIMETTD